MPPEPKVIGVNTLEVIARQAPAVHQSLWTVLDAQRGELFTARFRRGEGATEVGSAAVQIIARETWLAQLAPGNAVSGPGLERIIEGFGPEVTVVDRSLWQPRAATVGQLGSEQFSAGRRADVFQLAPLYFRRAAAEEQWELRHGPAG